MSGIAKPALRATRIGPILRPDSSRVLMRPFWPTTDAIAQHIVDRATGMSAREAADVLAGVLGEFGNRHEAVETIFGSAFARSATVSVRRCRGCRPGARRSSAPISPTSIRRSRPRSSILPLCRTRTSPDCPPVACVSSSASAPPARAYLVDHVSRRHHRHPASHRADSPRGLCNRAGARAQCGL